ncbi:Bidirectional sugar transporter sweet13 [Salvia divinorum]|uniref:Bidirectional sugar transporter SWEET n=1 Tax=Salvia divinorum TaxID=28513 RepID=A0ABD1GCD3_SALDI
MAGFSWQWALAFGLLGNIVSFMVFLSPIPTFYSIYKKKTSEGYQSLPYVVALFSSMLWIFYALLKSSNATLILTINAFGCFIETIYVCFYLFYAPNKARVQTLKMLVLLIICGFGFIVASTIYLVKPPQRATVVGWICLVFSLCVFVAPLCILKKVIQSKSVEYMPFLLSLFLTLSAVMWFFYGLLINDYNVAVPNVVGFSFGVVQMGVYVKYKYAEKMSRKQQKLPEAAVVVTQVVIIDEPIIRVVQMGV